MDKHRLKFGDAKEETWLKLILDVQLQTQKNPTQRHVLPMWSGSQLFPSMSVGLPLIFIIQQTKRINKQGDDDTSFLVVTYYPDYV